MKAAEIIKILHDIEERFPVEQWMVDDLHIWPIVRLDLTFSLHYSEFENLRTDINWRFKLRHALNILVGIPRYTFSRILDYKNNASPNFAVGAIFLGDGVSRVKLKDSWYEKFCDPFIDYFKAKKINSLLMEPLHRFIVPRYSPSMFIQPYLDHINIKTVFSSEQKVEKVELPQYDKFTKFIISKDLNIPIPTLERLMQIVLIIKAYSLFFKKIFMKTKPRLGFVVSYHNPLGLAFNLACRELGIPSVDIQHGVEGEYNGAYGHWTKVPPKGYSLLPSIFWCWSDTEAKDIEKWSKKVRKWHKPLPGGNLFLNFWRQDSNDLVVYYEELIKRRKRAVNILLTTSSLEPHMNIFVDKMVRVIKNADPNWGWWIRLHPVALNRKESVRQKLALHNITNFELDDVADLPLYAVMRHMDVHVTYASATVIEAEAFGVPSVIISKDGREYFAKQIKEGSAVLAGTPKTIEKAINVGLRKKHTAEKEKTSDKIRQEKALEFLLSKI